MFESSDPLQSAGQWIAERLGRESVLVRFLRPVFERALAWVHLGRGIPWAINGTVFRIDPRCRHLMGHDWEPEVADFLRSRVALGAVCLDVGANAGVYVLQLCAWAGSSGRVIAFEPNPVTNRLLQSHVRMNGFGTRVEVVACAITDSDSEATLHFEGSSGMSRLGSANPALAGATQEVTVSTTSLDRYCLLNKVVPDWVLVDIEGFELHALRGARQLLKEHPNLKFIVEMHPQLWSSAATSAEAWTRFLEDNDLKAVSLQGYSDPLSGHGAVYIERRSPPSEPSS